MLEPSLAMEQWKKRVKEKFNNWMSTTYNTYLNEGKKWNSGYVNQEIEIILEYVYGTPLGRKIYKKIRETLSSSAPKSQDEISDSINEFIDTGVEVTDFQQGYTNKRAVIFPIGPIGELANNAIAGVGVEIKNFIDETNVELENLIKNCEETTDDCDKIINEHTIDYNEK